MRNMTNRRLLLAAVTMVAGFLLLPQTASAHKPVVSGSATCLDGGEWSVTWTVTPSGDHPDLVWEVKRPDGVYSPSGPQPAPKSSSFTRTATYSAEVSSVTEMVWADWTDPQTGLVMAQSTRSGSVTRPVGCEPETTTPTIDSGSPTTTQVASAGPTSTLTAELPKTGTSSTAVGTWLGVGLVGLGMLLAAAARRKRFI